MDRFSLINDSISSLRLSANTRLGCYSLTDGIVSDPAPEEEPQDGGDVTPEDVTPAPSPPPTNNPPNGNAQGNQARVEGLIARWGADDETEKTPSPDPSVPSSPVANQNAFHARHFYGLY